MTVATKVAVIEQWIDKLGQQSQDQRLSGDPADRRLLVSVACGRYASSAAIGPPTQSRYCGLRSCW